MRPYLELMRLDKPIGIWLCFLPAAWLLAAQGAEPFVFMIFLFGAAVMRAAGCILNDLADRDFDKRVARTQSRPLAAGNVSMRHAIALLVLLLSIGLVIVLSLPPLALPLAICVLALIAAYPFMKRITYWPQLFLGITFNTGILFASIATMGDITTSAWIFYAAAIFWTLGYDTIYALQDTHDDALIGVKSTALRLGKYVPLFALGCYLIMWLLLVSAGIVAKLGIYYEFGLVLVAAHACLQIRRLRRGGNAGSIFRSNQWLGAALLLAILASQWQSNPLL
ncbi:MAG: 4-hydroxybenzoate octaprenyltransferase [Rickettsiales bacterium]